jgi:hypothetical protein
LGTNDLFIFEVEVPDKALSVCTMRRAKEKYFGLLHTPYRFRCQFSDTVMTILSF